MLTESRFRTCELRQDGGRRLSGVAIRYGDTATLPGGFRETFMPGAFGDVAEADVVLNRQHDRGAPLARTGGGGLFLRDSDEELRISAELPATSAADDALALVRAKVLRGLSIEFRSLREKYDGGVRIIERAALVAVAVVDSGAYPDSVVEARRRRGGGRRRRGVPNPWIQAQWDARKAGRCKCQGEGIASISFADGAFDDAVAGKYEVLAVPGGGYENAIASVSKGTLAFTKTAAGAIEVTVDRAALATVAGKALAETAKAVPVIARPIINVDESEYVDNGTVREFSRAKLDAVLLKPSVNSAGWDEVEIVDEAPPKRRARVWL